LLKKQERTTKPFKFLSFNDINRRLSRDELAEIIDENRVILVTSDKKYSFELKRFEND